MRNARLDQNVQNQPAGASSQAARNRAPSRGQIERDEQKSRPPLGSRGEENSNSLINHIDQLALGALNLISKPPQFYDVSIKRP